ncbi:MAG TPA: TadE family protein [Telluria sp.]|nr:TadE family protein [Telluria sp.]
MPGVSSRSKRRQRGAVAVEAGILATVFFLLVFGIIEIARLMFLWNTMSAATRRAATAVAAAPLAGDHTALLAAAAFNGVALTDPVIDGSYLRVAYLNQARVPITPPTSCAARNFATCMQNPADATCVRFVRVQLCDPNGEADACTPVEFKPLFGLPGLATAGGLQYPTFQTDVPAGALGYRPGDCS